MAKNKKVIISDKELTPTVIGEMTHKKANIIPIIILFALFISVAFFLPEIKLFVESGFDTSLITNKINSILGNTPEVNKQTLICENTTDIMYSKNTYEFENNVYLSAENYFKITNDGSAEYNLNVDLIEMLKNLFVGPGQSYESNETNEYFEGTATLILSEYEPLESEDEDTTISHIFGSESTLEEIKMDLEEDGFTCQVS